MRLRRCVVEHPFVSLKYRIFENPRFLLRQIGRRHRNEPGDVGVEPEAGDGGTW